MAKGKRIGLPWERDRYGGLWPRLLHTTKAVLFQPGAAFTSMQVQGGHFRPIVYCIILGWAGSAMAAAWRFLFMAIGFSPLKAWSEMAGLSPSFLYDQEPGAMGSAAGAMLTLALAPVLITVGLYVTTAVHHLFLMMARGAGAGFEATLRANAYATGATAIWVVIPFIGNLVYYFWWLAAMIIGLARAHDTSVGKALFAMLVPMALATCLCCGAMGMLATLGALPALMH